jgi:hypothetical protein
MCIHTCKKELTVKLITYRQPSWDENIIHNLIVQQLSSLFLDVKYIYEYYLIGIIFCIFWIVSITLILLKEQLKFETQNVTPPLLLFYSSASKKPGKWAVMYMYARGIDFASVLRCFESVISILITHFKEIAKLFFWNDNWYAIIMSIF